MYKKYLKSGLAMLLVAAHLMLIFGCDENPTETEKKEPPTLPPATTMQIDLSGISNSGQSLAKAATKNHFATAFLYGTVVNLWAVVGLSIPVGLFVQAASEDPVLESDGKFHWKFTSKGFILQYNTDLTGRIDVANKQSVWEMYVSSGERLKQFKYYDGRCALDLMSGYWTFYSATAADSGKAMIRLDWHVISETQRTLSFTNVLEGNDGKDDVLAYNVDGNNLSISFTDASKNETAIIHWDAITIAGCIESPNYNSGVPGCWDEDQNDIVP